MKKSKLYLYFAYGSNMLQSRLEARVGKVVKIGVAEIPGARIAFDYTFNEQSFANFLPNEGTSIKGVIYQLTEQQINRLDICEGADLGVEEFYNRYSCDIAGMEIQIYISTNRKPEFTSPVSQDYIDTMIAGYKENKIKHKKNLGIPVKHINNKLKKLR